MWKGLLLIKESKPHVHDLYHQLIAEHVWKKPLNVNKKFKQFGNGEMKR
jgi:hypothetical protein